MYQIINDEFVLNLENGDQIPCDVNNMNYQVYLNWIEDGNTPTE